jgi:peptidoglycan/xylan/chitin deacetylase (PgdA/CDA1 family)
MSNSLYQKIDRASASSGLVFSLERINGKRSNVLRALTYHRVADLKDSAMLDPRTISATPATFDQHMRYLAGHYQVVSLEEVFDAVEKGTCLPNRAVLITFDDAYCDFTKYAWPILKQFRLPATIFVPTAYPDRPDRALWWDRLHRAFSYTSQTELHPTPIGLLSLGTFEERRRSLQRLQDHVITLPNAEAIALVDEICFKLDSQQIIQKSILSWEELRQLAKEGVTLGAHTQTHPILTQISPKQVREETVGSQQDLRREIGSVLPVFCYPNGDHDELVVSILNEEGFVLAFTTLDGQNDLNSTNLLRLCRTNITRRTSLPILRLRLLSLVSYLDKWRHRKKQRQRLD